MERRRSPPARLTALLPAARLAGTLTEAGFLAYLLAIPAAPRLPAWLPEALILIMVVGLLLGRLDRSRATPPFGLLIPVLLFGLSTALSIAVSVSPGMSLRRAAYAPIALLIFLVAQEVVVGRAAYRRVLGTLGAVAAVLGFDGVYQAATGASLLGQPPIYGRVAASLPNPNDLALIPILVPAILTVAALSPRSWAARCLLIGLPPALATAILSGSRNVWLGLVVTMTLLVVIGAQRRYALVTAAGAVALFLVALVLGIGPTPAGVRRFFDFGGDARVGYWLVAWQMFLESPILGKGVHTFWEFYLPYLPKISLPPGYVPEVAYVPWPHNLFLEILSERGLVGGLAFAALLGAMGRGLRDGLRQPPGETRTVAAGLAASLGAFLVLALFDLTFWKDWPLFVFLLLAALIARLPTLDRT